MEKYNYMEHIMADVRAWIADNIDIWKYKGNGDKLREELVDDLWDVDSVTGNGSGSYTFNTEEAKENVLDNIDILREALSEFGETDEAGSVLLDDRWEWADVVIRCYLLDDAIDNVVSDLEECGVLSERRETA